MLTQNEINIFYEKYDLIAKTINVTEYGIVNSEDIESFLLDPSFVKNQQDLPIELFESDLTHSQVFYAVAEKKSDEPLLNTTWFRINAVEKNIQYYAQQSNI